MIFNRANVIALMIVNIFAILLCGCSSKENNQQDLDALREHIHSLSVSELCVIARNSDDRRSKDYAICELGARGDVSVVPFLFEMLATSKNKFPSIAVSLGEIGDKSIVPDLIKLYQSVESSDDYMKASDICWVLGMLEDKSAVPVLIDALKHKNKAVRSHAAKALGEIGDAAAVPALVELFNSNDNIVVKQYAAIALARLGNEVGKPLLLSLVRGKDPTCFHTDGFRLYASVALLYINDFSGLSILEDRIKNIQAGDWLLADLVAKSLIKVKDKQGVTALILMVDDQNISHRRQNVKLLEAVTGQSFGLNKGLWQEWWTKNKDSFEFK